MMILTAWNYAWSVFGACWVLGVALCLIDRRVGVHIYRFYYDVRHRKGAEMPKQVVKGLIFNQSTNRGVTVAVFLSTAYSLYMGWELGLHMNVVAEIFIWLLMPVALVIGFWSGGIIDGWVLKRNKYFDDFDRFKSQAGQVDVEGLKKKALDAAGVFGRLFPKRKPAGNAMMNGSSASDTKGAPPVEEDPRQALRRFTGEN